MSLVFFQELKVYAWTPIVHTMEPRLGYHIDEIFISFDILGQEYYFEELIVLVSIILSFLRYDYFHPDYGIDSRLLGFFVELECPIEISRIGDSEPRHPECLRLLHKSSWFPESREKRIVGMCMEMYEGHDEQY